LAPTLWYIITNVMTYSIKSFNISQCYVIWEYEVFWA